jgi:hypothetical protein
MRIMWFVVFYRRPATDDVYCLGLEGIDFNLPCSAVQTILGFPLDTNIAVSLTKVAVSHSLLWGKSAVKKLYKDEDRMAP